MHKGTEQPFSGEYWNHRGAGTYRCRRCDVPLYRSEDRFDAHCRWPSFDQEIVSAVRRVPDADGERIEIRCTACDGHLGYVFTGERFTDRDTRHCVNPLLLRFQPATGGGKSTQGSRDHSRLTDPPPLR